MSYEFAAMLFVAGAVFVAPAVMMAQGTAALPPLSAVTLPGRALPEPEMEFALELDIEGMHRAMVMARRLSSGELLLDAREIVAQAGWPRATAGAPVRMPAGRGGRTVIACEMPSSLPSGAPCFLPVSALASALDVVIEVDLAAAVVVIREATHLPVVRRIRMLRASRRSPLSLKTEHDSAHPAALSVVSGEHAHPDEAPTDGNWQTPLHAGGAAAPVLVPRRIGGSRGIVQLDYLLSSRWGGPSAGDDGRLASYVRGATHIAGGELGIDVRHDVGGTAIDNGAWSYRPRPGTGRPVVNLGVVDDAGPTPQRIRGVAFGNPLRETFRPRLVSVSSSGQDDWQYVGLVNDQWIAPQRDSDNVLSMMLPVTGDAARYDVIGWGPDGTERRYARIAHAPLEQLHRGEVRHLTSFGRCAGWSLATTTDGTACRWHGATDWRAGIHPKFTARWGTIWTDGRWQPYVGGNAMLGSAILVQGLLATRDANGMLARWQARWHPTPQHLVSVSADHSLARSTHLAQWQLAVPAIERLSVIGWWHRAQGRFDHSEFAHLGLVTQWGAMRTEFFGRVQRTALSSAFTPAAASGMASMGAATGISTVASVAPEPALEMPPASIPLPAVSESRGYSVGIDLQAAPRWLAFSRMPWWVRSTIALDRSPLTGRTSGLSSGFSSGFTGRVDLRLNGSLPGVELEIGRSYTQVDRSGRWMLMVTPRLAGTRLTTTVAHADRAGTGNVGRQTSGMTQTATGSLLVNAGAGTVRASADRVSRDGGLHVRTFLDLNGNGRFESGEPPLPDVAVSAGNRRLITDGTGRGTLAGLPASDPLMVSIDSASLSLPCWRPAAAQWSVQVPAAGIGEIDLPIHDGVILEGHVVAASPSSGAAANSPLPSQLPSQLVLVAVDGPGRHRVDVLHDGSFYLLGVPAGRYRLEQAGNASPLSLVHTVDMADSTVMKTTGSVLVIPPPMASAAPRPICRSVAARFRLPPSTLAAERSQP